MIKKIAILILVLAGTFTLYNCSDNDKKSKNQFAYLDELSHMECEAIKLREERFALADSVRFLELELLEKGVNLDPRDPDRPNIPEIEKFDLRKENLVDVSRNLADTIRMYISKATKDLSLEQKRVFNDSLQLRVSRLNCLEES